MYDETTDNPYAAPQTALRVPPRPPPKPSVRPSFLRVLSMMGWVTSVCTAWIIYRWFGSGGDRFTLLFAALVGPLCFIGGINRWREACNIERDANRSTTAAKSDVEKTGSELSILRVLEVILLAAATALVLVQVATRWL